MSKNIYNIKCIFIYIYVIDRKLEENLIYELQTTVLVCESSSTSFIFLLVINVEKYLETLPDCSDAPDANKCF